MTLVRAVAPELAPRSPDRFTIHGDGHLRLALEVLEGDCCPWPRERVPSTGGLAGDEAADWDIVEGGSSPSPPAIHPRTGDPAGCTHEVIGSLLVRVLTTTDHQVSSRFPGQQIVNDERYNQLLTMHVAFLLAALAGRRQRRMGGHGRLSA